MDQKKPFPLPMAASLDHQGPIPESHSVAKAHTFPTSGHISGQGKQGRQRARVTRRRSPNHSDGYLSLEHTACTGL